MTQFYVSSWLGAASLWKGDQGQRARWAVHAGRYWSLQKFCYLRMGALAALNAESGRRFDPHQVRLFEGIAQHVGVAIEAADLYRAQEEERELVLRSFVAMHLEEEIRGNSFQEGVAGALAN